MVIKKYTKEEIEKMEDKTDYERVKNMTEEETRKNAESDSDAPLQCEEDLEGFKRSTRRQGKNENN